MTRISKRFADLKILREKALVCFVVAGDPDIETTRRIVLELDASGADVVEIGIPFSDPIADGPSIQAASMRSLDLGTNVPAVFGLVKSIRKDSEIPIVLMTYYNPVMHYGVERFAAEASKVGVDGVIVTDLTPEEAGEWKSASEKSEIDTIFLLAPTSTADRIEKCSKMASGFVYCVSRTGVTGAQGSVAQGVNELVDSIREKTEKPIAVGFGISRAEHVREVSAYADGVVVGSKLVDLIASSADVDSMLADLHTVVSSLKSGTRG